MVSIINHKFTVGDDGPLPLPLTSSDGWEGRAYSDKAGGDCIDGGRGGGAGYEKQFWFSELRSENIMV